MLPVIATVATRCYPLLFKGEWTPTDVDGCILWLRADTIGGLADGAQVTTWSDESGEGNDATQSTAGKRPVYMLNQRNGLPVVRFDGEDDKLLAAVPDTAQPFTFFAVAKSTDKSSYYNIMGGSDEVTRLMIWSGTGVLHINAGINLNGPTDRSGAFHYFASLYNGANSWGRCDGTEDIADNAGTNNIVTAQTKGLYVGCDTGENWPWKGDIGEVLIYNNEVGTGDRTSIEEYLSGKWNL